jgi:RHS repeat-associated protein
MADSPSQSLLGFNGERQDTVLGGYHLGNGYRLYNPALRRFTAPDSMSPFGQGGINPYAYCAGDPINHTDPSGHFDPFVLAIIFGVDADIATEGGLAQEEEESIAVRNSRRQNGEQEDVREMDTHSQQTSRLSDRDTGVEIHDGQIPGGSGITSSTTSSGVFSPPTDHYQERSRQFYADIVEHENPCDLNGFREVYINAFNSESASIIGNFQQRRISHEDAQSRLKSSYHGLLENRGVRAARLLNMNQLLLSRINANIQHEQVILERRRYLMTLLVGYNNVENPKHPLHFTTQDGFFD